jgi:hypothetical protein
MLIKRFLPNRSLKRTPFMKNVFITLIILFVSSAVFAGEPVSKSYFGSIAIGGIDTTAYHLLQV